MPRYDFRCETCKKTIEVTCGSKEVDDIQVTCPSCSRPMDMIWWKSLVFRLGRTDGKETGFYNYDYGKMATWDLTPPGKIDRLKKEGVLRDPFDDVQPRRYAPGAGKAEIDEAFG